MSHYKLTSTVILHLSTSNEALGDMALSGNMTRQIEQDMPVPNDASHIVNIGKLVEDMELKMRNLLRMLDHCSCCIRESSADGSQRKSTSGKPKTWLEI